jgi:hypothetical protein
MECEKVRDRFSSLLERELNPLEEKAVREHLAFCSECQKDFGKFEKTLHWLHSVEEAEVPGGFLSEIHKKMEDQKKRGITAGKVRPGWFNTLVQLKLPVQAVAMVAIVLLVLYLTKMVPVETPHLMKEVEQEKAPQSEVVKEEAKLVSKETEKEKGTKKLPSETFGTVVAKAEEEAKSETAYIPKAGAPVAEAPQPKAAEKGKGPPSEPGRIQKMVMAQQRAYLAAKPPEEIILKITDREKALARLHELVKQFGGEIVKEEGNILLASLPATSFSEFEKELAELSSSTKSDEVVPQRDAAESKGASPGGKRKETEEKEKKPAKALTDKERRVSIRILLLPE